MGLLASGKDFHSHAFTHEPSGFAPGADEHASRVMKSNSCSWQPGNAWLVRKRTLPGRRPRPADRARDDRLRQEAFEQLEHRAHAERIAQGGLRGSAGARYGRVEGASRPRSRLQPTGYPERPARLTPSSTSTAAWSSRQTAVWASRGSVMPVTSPTSMNSASTVHSGLQSQPRQPTPHRSCGWSTGTATSTTNTGTTPSGLAKTATGTRQRRHSMSGSGLG